MPEDRLYFEDFTPGVSLALGPKHVTAEEIISFAREFDPQPMHLSEEDGKASLLGGLAASGWHTASMLMRMMCDSYILRSSCQGAPGIEFVEWKKPVLAGDTLQGRSIVEEARISRSRPQLGIVTFRHELENQAGELVCACRNAVMMRTKAGGDANAHA
ncbi:MaoC family dehydratase [Rhizobium paknamense]|uniref:Acyl dehydratase n=1 Tax=Rhizobium paknamense TaxID=1206817 RepID=A0ABU0I8F2_9HYPH|nr:MaoC family dehydratase [Rhizobium paknamense]MDQ0454503.1 acyl dehydratase [Rhizobium paknamense]